MNQILFATNRNRVGGKTEFGIDLDASCSYGTIDPCTREFKGTSKPDFLKAIRGSLEQGIDVVSYFHGFKATFEDSVDQVAKINSKYGNSKRQLVLFSWPSDGELGIEAYKRDRKDAEKSRRQIAQFLDDQLGQLSDETTGKIDVMCQSLGNRAFEYAVSKIKSKKELGEVVLSAPVIPRNAFESGQNLETLPKICDRVSLYFNPDDFAKYLAGILGEPNKMSLKDSAGEGAAVDTITAFSLTEKLGRLTARDLRQLKTTVPLDTLKLVVDLAVEIGREGREGKALKPSKLDSNVAVINCGDVLGMEHRYLYESDEVIADVNAILDGVASDDKNLSRKYVAAKNEYRLEARQNKMKSAREN